ncbi:NPCBM/NEW2 domain-containing protein [Kribbella sp. NBC_00709]|uniref:NPCBM/NEW2 domain-containing protein n=1 Tax=Kribbella sp. NBC_00709 TaxID=2975972 RepID=UPI002E28B67A|nr:NPCBM/NEW2 domain-containing protein [Kribbella sp. NBC_00709]
MGDTSSERKKTAWKTVLAVAVPILIGLVLVWAGAEDYRFPWARQAPPVTTKPTVGSSPPAQPTTRPTVRPTSSPPKTSAPPPTRPKVPPALLSDLPQVDNSDGVNSSIDLRFEGLTVNGDDFANSLTYRCSLYCNGSSPQTWEVSLGKKYRQFTALAAVADTAGGEKTTTKFEVDVDGEAHSYTARVGKPAPIKLDVRGALRLRIRIFAPADLRSPIRAGADSTQGKGSQMPNAGLTTPQLLG